MNSLLERAKAFLKMRHKKKIWYRAMYSMAVVVIFITTYMLILPAITMERDSICGIEEHVHTQECYEQASVNTLKTMNCTAASQGSLIHTHDDNCFDEAGNFICPLPELKAHVHTEACFTTGRNLVCGMSETESDFGDEASAFSDGDDLFGDGEAHVHTDACYQEGTTKICSQPEVIPHTHGEGCYDSEDNLICTMAETIEHQHTEECFTVAETASEPVLVCGKEEHAHTEDCYAKEEPAETPEVTETPIVTETPAEGEEENLIPDAIVTPETSEEETQEPDATVAPEASEAQEENEEETQEPDAAVTPEASETPEENEEETQEPEAAVTPEANEILEENEEETQEPDATVIPESTETPEENEEETSVQETTQTPEEGELSEEEEAVTPVPEITDIPEEEEPSGDDQETVTTSETSENPTENEEADSSPEKSEVPDEEPVYICGKETHIHDEDCYDEDGNLICSLEEHEHEANCIDTTVNADQNEQEPEYICGYMEHIHDADCYDEDGDLICGLEEHEHSEGCLAVTDADNVQDITPENDGTSWCVVYKDVAELPEEFTFMSVNREVMLMSADEGIMPMADSGNGADFGEYITKTEISKIVNGSWVSSSEFVDGDQVKVAIDYSIPAGIVDENNKIIYYQLPDGVKPLKTVTGPAYQDGRPVGTFVIDTTGRIEITFIDDFADGRSFTGAIQFEGTLSANEAGEGGTISFPGNGGTIVVNHPKEQKDIKVEKTGTLSADKTKIDYVITASTEKGTDGTVKISDRLGGTNTTALYNRDSFKIYKTNANGERTEITGYTPTFWSDNNGNSSFDIEGLPELAAGEKYEVEYTVDVSLNNGTDGSGSVTNNAGAKFKDIEKWTYKTIELSKKKIEKNGWYNNETGLITWNVNVNIEGSGSGDKYTLADVFKNGKQEFVGDIVVKDSKGVSTVISVNESGDGFNYEFPTDGSYTITYQTKAPVNDNSVENSATLKRGDEEYSASKDVEITHRTWGLEKRYTSEETDSNGIVHYNWQSEITLPEGTLETFEYSDRILDATLEDSGEVVENSHYAIASELDDCLRKNLKLTILDPKKELTYSEASEFATIEFFYYDADGNTVPWNNTEAKVKSFKVKVTPRDDKSVIGSRLILNYSTIADYTGMEAGETRIFKNKGAIPGIEKEASHSHSKPKPLVKQGGIYNADGQYVTYSNNDLMVRYEDQGGKLYYRVLINTEPDANGEIKLTDSLPSGASYIDGTLTAKFYYNDHYMTDGISWYDNDGEHKYNFTTSNAPEIKKQTSEGKNEIEITIAPGYNTDYIKDKKRIGHVIALFYEVSIEDDDWWDDLKHESKKYTNSIKWGDTDPVEQETIIEREIEEVKKEAIQVEGTADVEYTVTINPAGKDLDPNSDSIKLVDQLTFTEGDKGVEVSLLLEELALYTYDPASADCRGTLIDRSIYQVVYEENKHEMTITLPDELPCILVYRYNVNPGTTATNPKLSNVVYLNGKLEAEVKDQIINVSAAATVNKKSVKVYKVDSKDYTKRLEGAEFNLESRRMGGAWTEAVTIKTNSDGMFELSPESTPELENDVLYRLTEVTPPNNYTKSPKAYYFVVSEQYNTTDRDFYLGMGGTTTFNYDGVNISKEEVHFLGKTGGVLYVPNTYTVISVKKAWISHDGGTLTNHPDEVKVRLVRNSKKPEGYNVKVKIIDLGDAKNNAEKNIVVEPNTSLTVIMQEQWGWHSPYSIKKGEIDYGEVRQEGGHPTFISKPITENCEIIIEGQWLYGAEYLYTSPNEYTNIKEYIQDESGSVEYSLNSNNNWSYTWSGLAYEDNNGNPYYYTIEEETVPGFTTTYTNNGGIQSGDITVINTKNEDSGYELPETGGPGTKLYTLGGLLLSVLAVLLMYKQEKRRREVN